jgi:hypothetical protein
MGEATQRIVTDLNHLPEDVDFASREFLFYFCVKDREGDFSGLMSDTRWNRLRASKSHWQAVSFHSGRCKTGLRRALSFPF